MTAQEIDSTAGVFFISLFIKLKDEDVAEESGSEWEKKPIIIRRSITFCTANYDE